MNASNPHVGSSLESFLAETGDLEEVNRMVEQMQREAAVTEVDSTQMPQKKKTPPRPSGVHANPRILVTAPRAELEAWTRAAAREELDRSAWLRGLANAAVAAAPPEPLADKKVWRAARLADVIAIAEELKGAVISPGPTTNPRAITPGRLEGLLAKRSGYTGWTVTFQGQEFEALPPPMPKGWKP